MSPNFLFRAFHSGSVSRYTNDGSGFTAGNPFGPYPASEATDLRRHFDLSNTIPTRWVSTTSELLRALKIAINARISGGQGVCIAVIDYAECSDYNQPFSASWRSEVLSIEGAELRTTEFLVPSRIPDTAVVACLSLNTLISRGLFETVPELNPNSYYYQSRHKFHQMTVRELGELIHDSPDEWETNNSIWWDMGVKGAKVAACFGFGEHTEDIAIEVAEWWDSYKQGGHIERAIEYRSRIWVDFEEAEEEEREALKRAQRQRVQQLKFGNGRRAEEIYARWVREAWVKKNRKTKCFEV